MTVTYCILDTGDLPTPDELPNFTPGLTSHYAAMDAVRAAAADRALTAFSQACGLNFVQVDDPDLANIKFLSNLSLGESSWAYYPFSGSGYSGSSFVVMTEDAEYMNDADWRDGGWAYNLLLHEIGYAVGLDHPHENTLLDPALDNHDRTIMSYNSGWSGYLPDYVDRSSLAPRDVDAIRYLSGATSFADLGIVTSWDRGHRCCRSPGRRTTMS